MLKLELSEQQMGIVLQSLARQPFEMVVQVISEIQRQINMQQQPRPMPRAVEDQ